MSRYIEEEAIIKAIDESGQRYGITTANQCNFKEIVRKIPSTDVAPKSEVEALKVLLEMKENAYEGLKELYDTDTEALVKAREKTEVEVAREIFEEIEKHKTIPFGSKCEVIPFYDVAKLKKKYTEYKA